MGCSLTTSCSATRRPLPLLPVLVAVLLSSTSSSFFRWTVSAFTVAPQHRPGTPTSFYKPAAVVTRPPRSAASSTRLWVSIGLGPGKDETDTEEEDEELFFYDQNDTSDDPPGARFARMSKLDKKCDGWYASLLGPDVTPDRDGGCTLPPSITDPVRAALFHRVIPTDSEDVPVRDRDSEEWTPYITRRLPHTPYTPPFGLENYGIPMVRRGAEAWRQFDVPGLVEVDYSGRVDGLGTDLLLDESTAETYKRALSADGTWLDDDGCAARLVYVNGRYCPALSKDDKAGETASATVRNINAKDDNEGYLSRPDIVKCLQRLTDGFTDEQPTDEDDDDDDDDGATTPPPVLYSKMSGPDHNVGSARSQFAINSQQGTAAFAALNTLRAESVTLVDVPSNATVDKPVLILFAYTSDNSGGGGGGGGGTGQDGTGEGGGVAFHPRVLVKAGRGSRGSIVQSVVDLNTEGTAAAAVPKLHNGYTQFFVRAGANITHSYIDESGGIVTGGVEEDDEEGGAAADGGKSARQLESERPALADTIFECIDVQVTGEGGTYAGTMVGMGGSGRTRFAMSTPLLRPGAHVDVNGLMISGGAQRGDMRTTIHHVAEGCTSRQSQKNMVGGRATATFKGRIRVEQAAQLTDSQQLSRTLLLTDKCRIWAIPSLEIIADDVKCTHGATISDLSEEELFYLRSRGLDRSTSRNLLMYAFVDEVGSTVIPEVLGSDRAGLKRRIIERLQNLVPKGDRAIMGEFQSV